MKRVIIFIIALMIIVLFFFIKIIQTENRISSGMFLKSDCMIACWRGLKAGQTTQHEVENFINKSGVLKPETVQIHHYSDSTILYTSKYINNGFTSILVSEGILFSIDIEGHLDLKLSTIIQNIGIPNYIHLITHETPTGDLEISVKLYYPSQGYYFTYIPSSNKTENGKLEICFRENDYISTVGVSLVGSVDEFIGRVGFSYNYEPTAEEISQRVSELQTWPGFSCVQK